MVALAPITNERPAWDVLDTFPKLHSRAREAKTTTCTEAPMLKSRSRIEIWLTIYETCDRLESFTRDPIGFKGGFSLYQCLFAMKGLDPSGREGLDADTVSRTCDQVASAYGILKLSDICPLSQFTFRVRCVSCGQPSEKWPAGAVAQTSYNKNPALLEVLLCNDRVGAGIDSVAKLQQSLMSTVLHEWVHAGDYCNCSKGCDAFKPWKIPFTNLEITTKSCERFFCSEIRAKHADGECDGEDNDEKRRDCFKRKMRLYLPGQPNCNEANIDKAMRECYQKMGEELKFPHDFLK